MMAWRQSWALGRSPMSGSWRLPTPRVSPAGVAVLAGSPLAGRLRRLDLSTNELGIEGAEGAGRRTLAGSAGTAVAALRLGRRGHRRRWRGPTFAACVISIYRTIRSARRARWSLATSARLENLWRLNLHDNFIGDTGLIALARSSAPDAPCRTGSGARLLE